MKIIVEWYRNMLKYAEGSKKEELHAEIVLREILEKEGISYDEFRKYYQENYNFKLKSDAAVTGV